MRAFCASLRCASLFCASLLWAVLLGGCGDAPCEAGASCASTLPSGAPCEGALVCGATGESVCVCDGTDAGARDAGDGATTDGGPRDGGVQDGGATDAGDGDAGPPPELKAFPSAIGAGAYATGGRGGQVIHVTTLDWAAPGGLREALTTPGPRIVVFDVAGEIDATAERPYVPVIRGDAFDDLTIAGQSAPEGGITIRTSELLFEDVDNVVVRYLRFRQDPRFNQDAFWLQGCSRVVVDHCTFSHGGDEAASVASSVGASGDVTVQRSFFQDSKTGMIVGVDDVAGDFTLALNLWTNVSHRFPNPKGEGHYDIVNNVVYNWRERLVRITGGGTYNIVNNHYRTSAGGLRSTGWFGATGDITRQLHRVQTRADDEPRIFAAGSLVLPVQRPSPQADDRDMFLVFAASHLPEHSPVPDAYFVTSAFPFVGAPFPLLTAAETYEAVLGDVGANATLDAGGAVSRAHDDKDAADLAMVRADSYAGAFYDPRASVPWARIAPASRPAGFDTDRDGMPDAYERDQGLDPADPSDGPGDADGDGYTNVEEYLNRVDG